MRPLLFVFLDGVGLGAPDPATNPFVAAATPFLCELLGGPLDRTRPPLESGDTLFRPLDATLGVPGLPQSATGQTALLTGINGAQIMQRHYGPWPGPTLKRLLDGGTLFHDGRRRGGSRLANAYPPGYFLSLQRGRMRENVPVYAARAAGLTLPTLADYRDGLALAADITGAYFAELDPELTPLTPTAAGARLAQLAAATPFTFFDFWASDRTGHRAGLGEAVALVERLDAFLGGVMTEVAGSGVTVLITSDHGNLDEIGNRRHTFAPVPLIVHGPGAHLFAAADSLLDVAPAVRAWWATGEGNIRGRPSPH